MNAKSPQAQVWFTWGRFWLGVILGLTTLLVAGYCVSNTDAGRDLALSVLAKQLPSHSALRWQRLEGKLSGPLTIEGLDYHQQDLHFQAQQATVDVNWRCLWRATLCLTRMQVRSARLMIPQSHEPFTWPTWPKSAPRLAFPINIVVPSLQIDAVQVGQGQAVWGTIDQVRGRITVVSGALAIRHLHIVTSWGAGHIHGDYRPEHGQTTALNADWTFPGSTTATPMKIGVAARGRLDQFDVALAGWLPGQTAARLSIRGRHRPRWTVSATGTQLDFSRWRQQPSPSMPAQAPFAVALVIHGWGDQSQLAGHFSAAKTHLAIDQSAVKWLPHGLLFQPLQMQVWQGLVTVRGRLDLAQADHPQFQMTVNARGLHQSPAPSEDHQTATITSELTLEQAEVKLHGAWPQWQLQGQAHITHASRPDAWAHILATGNAQSIQITQLAAQLPGGGQWHVTGQVQWQPQWIWQGQAQWQHVDPGYFWQGWDGQLSGKATCSGSYDVHATAQQSLTTQVNLTQISGQLRQQPLRGDGHFVWQQNHGGGRAALHIGRSHLAMQAEVGERLAVHLQMLPFALEDVLPSASGVIQGQIDVTGARTAPTIRAQLQSEQLHWQNYFVKTVKIDGVVPWQVGRGQLTVRAQQLQLGLPLTQWQLVARGSVVDHQLQMELTQPQGGHLTMRGHLQRQPVSWQGSLDHLLWQPPKGATVQLSAPVFWRMQNQSVVMSQGCLRIGRAGELCAQVNWPRQGLTLHGRDLPLSLLEPWLPKPNSRAVQLRGVLSIDGNLRPQAGALAGELRLASREGSIGLAQSQYAVLAGNTEGSEQVRYDQFSTLIRVDPQQIVTKFGIGFRGDGYIDAQCSTGWNTQSPLTGELYFNMARLYWLEFLVADLVKPSGSIAGHVSLRGTRGAPLLGGEANLTGFSAHYPSIGVTLSDGEGHFVAQPDGSAQITTRVRSGDGIVDLAGRLSWFGDATPLQLTIRGQNVLVYNTNELRVYANPAMQLSIHDHRLLLRGDVVVPRGVLDLEHLDRRVNVSDDAVVADPVDPQQPQTSAIDLDLQIVLGQAVALRGFGLKGSLSGQLQVRAQPGEETIANGGLDVHGRYRAYGQDLTITRGQLLWNNNIVSDPRINIRAERQINEVTAGIDVSGRALSPRAEVWSDPVMSQSEALSYLVLGHSLTTASDNENQQVSAASAALSAGGGLLASRVGAKLGLDDAGVSQSSTLGSVLGVGKYLSPKLYVGYGVSMIGGGSAFLFKYLLGRGFDVEVESSTIETRGSLNWRREK